MLIVVIDDPYDRFRYNRQAHEMPVGGGIHRISSERLYHCVLLALTLYSPKLHWLERFRFGLSRLGRVHAALGG
ncbi:hypothetical protein ABIC30_006078 [Methylobacterium sp. 1030]